MMYSISLVKLRHDRSKPSVSDTMVKLCFATTKKQVGILWVETAHEAVTSVTRRAGAKRELIRRTDVPRPPPVRAIYTFARPLPPLPPSLYKHPDSNSAAPPPRAIPPGPHRQASSKASPAGTSAPAADRPPRRRPVRARPTQPAFLRRCFRDGGFGSREQRGLIDSVRTSRVSSWAGRMDGGRAAGAAGLRLLQRVAFASC